MNAFGKKTLLFLNLMLRKKKLIEINRSGDPWNNLHE